MGLGRRILYRAALDEKSHWSVRLVTKKISEAPQIPLGVAFGDAAGDALRTSPTGPRKRTLSDRLRPRGLKMRQEPGLAARRILTGSSTETQKRRIFASGCVAADGCVDAPSDRSLFHQARLAASHRVVSSTVAAGASTG
jgi:hypothetical protein